MDDAVTNLAVFAAVYLPALALVLYFGSRHRERCDRCGETWKKSKAGNDFHICQVRGVFRARRA